jgi:hypothetical protein
MSLLTTILSAQGGSIVEQIAGRFDLDKTSTENAIRSLVPLISNGIQRNMSDQSGIESLVNALTKGNHESYLDNPDGLSDPAATEDGNSILGHIFGSKDVSRQAAARAAGETGLNVNTLKKMLPLLATTTMGAMSKEESSSSGGILEVGGLLSSFLKSDNDGSVTEGLFDLAKKLF